MNRVITSILAAGVGATAANMARNRNMEMLSSKNVKKLRKRISKAIY
ncbi:DUF3918 domain-containing protein [Bacillus taeanensis]|uniref:DUF3918 domain-containing protein n=1 Tax=Bacillus taeanensis TaxID=273032 RepID=A0A366XX22_9BACI|nr:DUF3918 domain-containing protein [Bacillus taeanensis]